MKFTLLLSNCKNMLHLKKSHKLLMLVNYTLFFILTGFFLIGVGRASPLETNFEFGISSGDELVFYLEQRNSLIDPTIAPSEKYVSYQKYTIEEITIIDPTSCRISYNVFLNITIDPDYENLSHWDLMINQTDIISSNKSELFILGPFLPLDTGLDDAFTEESFAQLSGLFGTSPIEGDYETIVHENRTTFSASEFRLSFEMIFEGTIDGEHVRNDMKITQKMKRNHIFESMVLSGSSTIGGNTTYIDYSSYLVYSNLQGTQTFYDYPSEGEIIQTILRMTGGISLVVIAIGLVSYISYSGVGRLKRNEKIKSLEDDILKIEKIIDNHNFNEAHQKLMEIHQEFELLDDIDYSLKIENLMKICRINSEFLEQRKIWMDKFNKGEIRFAYRGLVELLKEVNKPEYFDWIDASVTSEITDSLKKVASNL